MPAGLGPLRVYYQCQRCDERGVYDGAPKRDNIWKMKALEGGLGFECDACGATAKLVYGGDGGIQISGAFDRIKVEDSTER